LRFDHQRHIISLFSDATQEELKEDVVEGDGVAVLDDATQEELKVRQVSHVLPPERHLRMQLRKN
jgi:hypothetical protein